MEPCDRWGRTLQHPGERQTYPARPGWVSLWVTQVPEAATEEAGEKEEGSEGDQHPHCNGNGRCHAAVWTCGESGGYSVCA